MSVRYVFKMSFPDGSVGKESDCNARDMCKRHGFYPWVRKIPWRGNGNPLQYSCLENPIDRGPWQATDHEVAESDMTEHTCKHIFKVILHLAFFYAQIK